MPKKKARSIGVTVLAFLFLIISVPPSTSAIPQTPNMFWGTVTVSESPAVDGLIVSARIGGVEYASTTTSGGSYDILVPVDDPDTPGKEGGVNDETVEFYVAGVKAAQTGTFSVGDVTELNLTVDDVSPPTVTLPAYTPDPTTNNTPTYSGTATDALTNVVEIKYRVDGGAWTDVDAFTPALSVSFTFTTPELEDGTHLIEVKAGDAAGNWSEIVSDTLTVALPATDFSIGVSPTSGSVVQGGSTSATVSVSSIEGFSETVSLFASGLPSGATATFSPSSGTPSFSSTLTISTSTTTPAGTRTITITGTGGGKTHTYNFALTVTTVVVPEVPDFSIGVSPTSGSVVQGGSTSATVSVSSIEGFSSTVDLSASGLPSGATTSFSPASGTPSFTSTLTISTSSTTPAGTYTITITGTGGGKTRTCTYALTVTPAVPIPPGIIEVESPPVEIPFITPDENVIIEVENTIITKITIVVRESVENVRITVQQLTDKPAGIAIGTPGVAYRYLNIVAENISDADIDVVLIEFRVEKAWVSAENIDPDTIALRRWDPIAEVWESLPTTRIREDDTYYYYSAESPGLSIFAVSGLTLVPAPEFELSNLVVDPSEVGPGETITVSIAVTNVSEFEGTCTVTLKINNVIEATEDVTLAGGTMETVTFQVSRDVEGTYNVEVDGLTGTFVVITPPPLPTVPLAIAVTGIALLAGGLGYAIYRQKKLTRLRKTQLRRLKWLKKTEEGRE